MKTSSRRPFSQTSSRPLPGDILKTSLKSLRPTSDQSRTSLRPNLRRLYNIFATSLCRLGRQYTLNAANALQRKDHATCANNSIAFVGKRHAQYMSLKAQLTKSCAYLNHTWLYSLPTFTIPLATEVVLINRNKLFKTNLSRATIIYFRISLFYNSTLAKPRELNMEEVKYLAETLWKSLIYLQLKKFIGLKIVVKKNLHGDWKENVVHRKCPTIQANLRQLF